MSNTLPEFFDMFAALIAQPSISSTDPDLDHSNKPVVELLSEWFEKLGFKVEIMSVKEKPEKLNLIATMGKGEGGLVLSGHTDTVPYDESAWSQDPFTLTEMDNKFYGLGASDMKCFFPIVIEMLKEEDLSYLKQPLYILATCDEESTMAGAKALVDAGRRFGRSALIGEPTGLRPINMHKGVIMEAIKLYGQAGHSSDPALGNSALEGMHKVMIALLQWRDEIQSKHRNPAFKVPVPTLNFGSIHGGDNPNRICAECELKIDIRLLPGMDLETVRAGIRSSVMQAIDGLDLTVEFDPIFPGLPGLKTDVNTEIIKLAEQLTGQAAGTVAFGTEGPYFNALGMDTVILGPGDIAQAHQANEYLSVDRITPMQEILSKMLKQFCMKEIS